MSNILMTASRSRVVRLLIRSGPCTCRQISARLSSSSSSVRRHLAYLEQAGVVQRLNPAPFGHHDAVQFVVKSTAVQRYIEALALHILPDAAKPSNHC